MAVPSQKQLHRPTLEIVGAAHEEVVSFRQVKDHLIDTFSLSESDLLERVPSGRQTRFENRVYWAASYLRRAGLLHSPSRARFVITWDGRELLANQDGDIETAYLNELIEARRQRSDANRDEVETITSTIETSHVVDVVDTDSANVTPDERMSVLYSELNDRLADELLESVKGASPDQFERLVVRLLEKMEYGQGQDVGRSGDEGIDGIINQDPLGLEKVYIQAKRWQSQVGEPEIRNFSGSLQAKGASKGVFVTTSTFSSTAQQTAQLISAGNKFIRLINGEELARLMIMHDVGVITEVTYSVKTLDENYFVEDL